MVLNKEEKMRHTRQKNTIDSLIHEGHRHLKADELFEELNEGEQKVSLATVYRRLDKLAKDGTVVKRYNEGDNSYFYDTNASKHDHFICDCCHKVYDIIGYDLDTIDDKIKGSEHLINSHTLIFHGICKECLEKGEK